MGRYTIRGTNLFDVEGETVASIGLEEYRKRLTKITIQARGKLSQLEDIEEDSGLCETGSSLIAFLQTPYIQSILKLYVDVRKLRGLSDKVDNCEMNDYNVSYWR